MQQSHPLPPTFLAHGHTTHYNLVIYTFVSFFNHVSANNITNAILPLEIWVHSNAWSLQKEEAILGRLINVRLKMDNAVIRAIVRAWASSPIPLIIVERWYGLASRQVSSLYNSRYEKESNRNKKVPWILYVLQSLLFLKTVAQSWSLSLSAIIFFLYMMEDWKW